MSGPPAALADGCLILPPGAGRRTTGWRGRSPFPPPAGRVGASRSPGVRVITGPFSLPRRRHAPGAGICCGVFDVAGLSLPVVLGGLGACFPGLPEGLVCPAARVLPPVLPRVLGAALRACFPGSPDGGFFALFARRFPVRRGAPETPGGAVFRRAAEKRTCARKVRGGIQLRVVGSARLDLCNERSFRTDVSICTIFRYGSDRACVQEKCPAAGEGGTGGVLV